MRRGRQKRRIHAAGVGHHQVPSCASRASSARSFAAVSGATIASSLAAASLAISRLCARRHGSDYTVEPFCVRIDPVRAAPVWSPNRALAQLPFDAPPAGNSLEESENA